MRSSILKATLAAAALLAFAPAANADSGVRVGTLECRVQEGWGHVVASDRDMTCAFRPVDGRTQTYTGTLRRYGLDIGYTSDATLVWAVVAPSSEVGASALEGDYAGASAAISAGLGLGANVLVGGLDRSIALQPLSVEGNTGVAIAAGVGVITLRQGEAVTKRGGPRPPRSVPRPLLRTLLVLALAPLFAALAIGTFHILAVLIVLLTTRLRLARIALLVGLSVVWHQGSSVRCPPVH